MKKNKCQKSLHLDIIKLLFKNLKYKYLQSIHVSLFNI